MNPTELDKSRELLNRAQSLGITGSGVNALSAVVAPTTITSETLGGNITPVKIPETPVSTTAEGITGASTVYVEQGKERAKLQAEQDLRTQELTNKDVGLKDKLAGLFGGVKDILGSRGQLEEEAKIAEKVNVAEEAQISLEQSQRAQVNELRALDSANMTDAGRATATRDINRKYAFEQADLMLTVDIAERRLDRAQRTIDKKIELALEPIKLDLDFTKFFYEDNKADLTKAEDRAFNTRIAELDRQYEETKALEQYKGDIVKTAMQNGVQIPSYVLTELNGAKTQAEVAQVLARNGISLQNPLDVAGQKLDLQIKQAQLAKLRKDIGGLGAFDGYLDETEIKKIDASPQGKKVKALGDLKQKAQGYKELVEKYGTETPLGGQKAILESAFADLKIAYKEAANLGALTGPDVALLEEAIQPATSGGFLAPIKRFGRFITRQGRGSILSGIDQTLGIIDKNAETNFNQLLTRDPRYASSFYVQELAQPFSNVLKLGEDELLQLLEEASPEQLDELRSQGLIE